LLFIIDEPVQRHRTAITDNLNGSGIKGFVFNWAFILAATTASPRSNGIFYNKKFVLALVMVVCFQCRAWGAAAAG